jgi:putative protein kinase ArgK-like GTPase of G3E family
MIKERRSLVRVRKKADWKPPLLDLSPALHSEGATELIAKIFEISRHAEVAAAHKLNHCL